MTTRNVFAFLLACCLVLALVECARAQPASSASAASAPALLTRADVKPTACGEGGIGEVYAGFNRGRIEAREGRLGQRVNEQGFWESGCTPPPPPPPPKACPAATPTEWTVGAHTCTAKLRAMVPSGATQTSVASRGMFRGVLIERCTDGARSTVTATCDPVTHCDMGWRGSIGGTTYVYALPSRDKLPPLGGYVTATAADGSTQRLQCVAGEIKPAPQCVAGQRVTQRYSGGPVDPATGKRVGEVRVYEYAGQPIDPGKLATLTQIEGRRKPDGSPRTTIARCSNDGRLE